MRHGFRERCHHKFCHHRKPPPTIRLPESLPIWESCRLWLGLQEVHFLFLKGVIEFMFEFSKLHRNFYCNAWRIWQPKINNGLKLQSIHYEYLIEYTGLRNIAN
ncbi:hypothetical protein ACB094_03G052000 [Castanea mollissima]